ncbi:MAG TPA: NUDIX domain-containing protein [Acidimicrobiales bacterium]|jgi:ADP-ribose pyrophosphatase YjhB (NUDIX family)|nr:NUDIX domain-containing protein [Acidimicrobiales bacterium]
MTDRQRIAAYGLCVDNEGRILLARAAPSLTLRGRWFLPGGGVDFGEAPADAVLRELFEESGLTVTLGPLIDVMSDVRTLPDGTNLHTVRVIYRVQSWEGVLTPEVSGTTDAIRWVDRQELAELPLAFYVQEVVERYL